MAYRWIMARPQPRIVGGHRTREIFEGGLPVGFAAECPFCGETNEARFGPDRFLVWWVNDEVGTWCSHATGCYEGGTLPQFLFRGVGPQPGTEPN